MDRHDPTIVDPTCHLRITKPGHRPYDKMFEGPIERSRDKIARLRKRGLEVEVTWLTGMGLGIG